MVFTTLAHLIDVEFLHEAFRRTRKNASPGGDGVTAAEYAANLSINDDKIIGPLYGYFPNGMHPMQGADHCQGCANR